MNLLVDNQLPPALARFIESEFGCAGTHVADIGLHDASDAEVWHYASKISAILVSKDEDFATHGSPRADSQTDLGQNRQLPQGFSL